MKKYVKPDLLFESFELSHSVANCSPAMNQSRLSCKYEANELFGILEENETVFSEGACTYSEQEFLSIFSQYCDQTGSEGYQLFTS